MSQYAIGVLYHAGFVGRVTSQHGTSLFSGQCEKKFDVWMFYCFIYLTIECDSIFDFLC